MSYQTIAEAIARGGEVYPEAWVVFQDLKGEETRYTFAELDQQTATRAAALQSRGLRKGDRVGIVVVEPEDFVLTFLGALRVGIVPVPMYPPLSMGSLDAYAERSAKILESSDATLLVASGSLQNVLWSLVGRVPSLRSLVKIEDLRVCGTPAEFPPVAANDLAFLQFTSGSTSDPKGVMVTHGNLVANALVTIAATGDGYGVTRAITWLPLYHDMGLIGFVINPIVTGLSVVYIPTLRFVKRPQVWFDTITKHSGTTTFAPNFAYALVTKKAKPEDVARWDLSHVRCFGCGAEPIHGETMREFEAKFQPAGLRSTAIAPAYGMAEATLCMSLKRPADRFTTRVVDAERFQADGVAADVVDDTVSSVVEHVACGPALDGHDVAAFSEEGERRPEGVEGELCFRGPSVTPGYWQKPELNAELFRGDWLRTGDLGYLFEGQVYVTGRLKDLIILNGKNVHPQSIEWIAAEVEGVRKGNVVAFSVPGEDSEELVVALETRAEDPERVVAAVRQQVREQLGLVVAQVVCLEVGALPKTSSGKLQRRRTRDLYLRDELGQQGSRLAGSTADKLTLARHVAASMWSRAKSAVLNR
jgi:fatty-acyl-CoA synthase